MSLIKSVFKFFDDKKKQREDEKNRVEKYSQYLVDKSVEINLRIQEEKNAINYHAIEPYEILELVNNQSRRVFEKSRVDSDFLQVRIGNEDRFPSFKVELQEQKIDAEYDELYDDAKEVTKHHSTIKNVGLTIDLKESNVGIIGTKELSMLIVKQMLLDIMTLHSYHEVQFLLIFDKEYYSNFEWFSYSPSCKIEAINIRGLVYTEVLRDQILGSFVQILKDREQRYNEDSNVEFSPHYVVTVMSNTLVNEHSINEFLAKDIRHLGVSIIVVENEIENLKDNIKTVVEIYSKRRSRLLIENGNFISKNFNIDNFPTIEEITRHARNLKGYNHVIGSDSGLPKMITFLEMYDVTTVEELDVKTRWNRNDCTKTMAVRLGVTGENYVELDLHEKAHGPHGLVAGTTGSGKSEIIQSYILSLAVNFHPYEVAFLLIDYKGGGMANLFNNLPHLIGTITNLDGSGSMRALASIKAELLRRQEIFSKNNVNHINQYIHLFKNGDVTEPMPHLFLISDEFAELKAEQPEFMAELVSTARIGRSLGIHLILATQKPSGVVDGQIWSNSKFKLCLKVQDASDSKEMLKTTDAANIVEPGRAYLQVGNNEIYELFQSAWSGADYYGEKAENNIDKRMYVINRLGQYKLLTKDLSGFSMNKKAEKVMNELEAVVQEISNEFGNKKKVAPIWLEDLQERYYLSDYIENDFSANSEKIMLGIVDMPNRQSQTIFDMKLEEVGNMAIIGSSGFGKSYAIMTMLLSLYKRNDASSVYSYIIDFGSNALIGLKNIPHVAEYLTVDDEEKLGKFVKIINEEIDKRKRLFASQAANHISVYNDMVEDKLAKIVITLDNFDVVKDEFAELQEFFTKLSRDCTSLGIYLLFSATRLMSFRASMINNLKTRIVLYNTDKYEYSNAVGKSDFYPKEIPGSALVKYDKMPYVTQIMLPSKGETDVEMLNNLKRDVEIICDTYEGEKPKGISTVEGKIDINKLIEDANCEANEIVIGVDYETVSPMKVNLSTLNLLSIISSSGQGKTNLTKIIASQNIDGAIYLTNSIKANLECESYSFSEISEFEDKLKNGELVNKILIIDSLEELVSNLKTSQMDAIASMIENNALKVIVAFNHDSLRAMTNRLSRMIKTNSYNILQTQPGEQRVVDFTLSEKKSINLKIGDAIVVLGSVKTKVKVPFFEEGRDE